MISFIYLPDFPDTQKLESDSEAQAPGGGAYPDRPTTDPHSASLSAQDPARRPPGSARRERRGGKAEWEAGMPVSSMARNGTLRNPWSLCGMANVWL